MGGNFLGGKFLESNFSGGNFLGGQFSRSQHYMLKANSRSTKTRCEISLKSRRKSLEQCH